MHTKNTQIVSYPIFVWFDFFSFSHENLKINWSPFQGTLKITFVELNIKLKTTWCKKISLQIQNYPRFVLDTCDSKETAYMLRAVLRNAM